MIPLMEEPAGGRLDRRVLVLCVLLAWAGADVPGALAVVAAPGTVILEQPDGSRFSARHWGDGRAHGFATLSGVTIVQDAGSGTWFYAVLNCQGGLVASTVPVKSGQAGRLAEKGFPHGLRPSLNHPSCQKTGTD